MHHQVDEAVETAGGRQQVAVIGQDDRLAKETAAQGHARRVELRAGAAGPHRARATSLVATRPKVGAITPLLMRSATGTRTTLHLVHPFFCGRELDRTGWSSRSPGDRGLANALASLSA